MKSLSIPWIREEDWSRWCSIIGLKAQYQSWLGQSEISVRQCEALGYNVVKVILNPDEFIEWSRYIVEGKTDSMARAAFAAAKSMRRDTAQPTVSSIGICHHDDLLHRPNVVVNASFHRRSNAKRFLNATKVMEHEVQPNREHVIF